jgi:hypothetical protein
MAQTAVVRQNDVVVELFGVDPSVARLADVGFEPSVWVDGTSLTVAVRRAGDAPLLIGTLQAPLRAAGDGVWALGMDINGMASACIEYGVVDPADPGHFETNVWRGPRGAREASRTRVTISAAEVIADSPFARRHRVRACSPSRWACHRPRVPMWTHLLTRSSPGDSSRDSIGQQPATRGDCERAAFR